MWLRRKLREFFGTSSPPPPRGGSAVAVTLELPPDGETIRVGTLAQSGGQFVFEYSKDFRDRTDLPAISAFPDKERRYTSKELFPFFQVRIPPESRRDVQEALAGVERSDPIRVLAAVGRESATSPFKLTPTDSIPAPA